MAQESETSRPIPISQARSKRELSPKIETNSDELRQILSEVIDQFELRGDKKYHRFIQTGKKVKSANGLMQLISN